MCITLTFFSGYDAALMCISRHKGGPNIFGSSVICSFCSFYFLVLFGQTLFIFLPVLFISHTRNRILLVQQQALSRVLLLLPLPSQPFGVGEWVAGHVWNYRFAYYCCVVHSL